MNEQQIKSIVQQEIAKTSASNQFKQSSTNYHTHNGSDSLLAQPGNILTYIGIVAYDGTAVLLPTGWTVGQDTNTATSTAGIAMGATSATLTGNWILGTSTNKTYFSNGDIRNVSYTNGSTHISWSGGLSSNATSSFEVTIPGIYRVIHNLGTTGHSTPFYSFVVSGGQGTNIVCVPVVSQFSNEAETDWFDQTGIRQQSTFVFNLTIINNKLHSNPTYYGTSISNP